MNDIINFFLSFDSKIIVAAFAGWLSNKLYYFIKSIMLNMKKSKSSTVLITFRDGKKIEIQESENDENIKEILKENLNKIQSISIK